MYVYSKVCCFIYIQHLACNKHKKPRKNLESIKQVAAIKERFLWQCLTSSIYLSIQTRLYPVRQHIIKPLGLASSAWQQHVVPTTKVCFACAQRKKQGTERLVDTDCQVFEYFMRRYASSTATASPRQLQNRCLARTLLARNLIILGDGWWRLDANPTHMFAS